MPSNETEIRCGEPEATSHETKDVDGKHTERQSQPCSRFAEGMGLGMKIALDGRRGRSVRLVPMGLEDRTESEEQGRQGLERCSGAVSPRLKAE